MGEFLQNLRRTAVDFYHLGCGSLAASLAFFALLSLFPTVFLLLNILGLFFSQDHVGQDTLINFIQGFLPNMGSELIQEIERVAQEEVVQWVVLFTFIWFAILVFYEVEYAVQVVFRTKKKRHPIIATLRSITLLLLVAMLLILSLVITQITNLAVSLAPRFGGLDVMIGVAGKFALSYLLPFVLLFLSATCLYRYLPDKRPKWREAFIGGLFLALLWEAGKHIFSTYVQNLSIYGRMYGSLLVVVLFLIWIYYSAALFLFGAALVYRLRVVGERWPLSEEPPSFQTPIEEPLDESPPQKLPFDHSPPSQP